MTLLYALAQEYHQRCEAYDRTVCTGGVGRDGVMPADGKQMALINRHASKCFAEIRAWAEAAGIAYGDLRYAIAHFNTRAGV